VSTYHCPRTLDEALNLKAETTDARYVAGGTDLLVRMKNGVEDVRSLISLRSLPELAAITVNGAASIGAMATLTDVLEHPALGERYPVLVEAVGRIGSVQIRNVATLGGNLASAAPCADSAPALLVLEAKVRIAGRDSHRDLPLDELFTGPRQTCLGPEEVLTAILLDPPRPAARGVFLKKTRVHIDLALASVAVLVELDADRETCSHVRIAAGSVAPTPLRLPEVETLLAGERITPELVERARELARDGVSPISDVRASADYRRHLTGALLARGLSTLSGGRPA
ncbi:MAG: xanthine dehydrogenase family protein subunit M, partial [bacterium]|nr:xanthine dehydrogenase family protein subunit M [bacterium]